MNESPMLVLDKSALQEPVPDSAAAAEATQRIRSEGGAESEAGISASAIVRTVVLVLGAWALAVVFVRIVQMLFGAPGVSVTTIVSGALMVVPLTIAQVRGVGGGIHEMRRTWYRLARFAEANGVDYTVRRPQVPDGATLFEVAGAGVATDVVTRSRPRAFEAGNYAFETWSGRARMPHTAAYAAFALGHPVPLMTLISTSNAGGALAWTPDPRQRTIDVDPLARNFRVQCLPGDEAAVRRTLTPDFCTRLIALAEHVDVESVGDRVFFIARRGARMDDPAFWEWVEDLSRMLDSGLDPRPETAGVPVPAGDAERAQRRSRLFRLPHAGRPFLIGCLIPLIGGIALAVLTAGWR